MFVRIWFVGHPILTPLPSLPQPTCMIAQNVDSEIYLIKSLKILKIVRIKYKGMDIKGSQYFIMLILFCDLLSENLKTPASTCLFSV